MTNDRPKPTRTEILLWAVPTLVALVFTIIALVVHQGVEWGLGAMLFGILYFLIRYGNRVIETPDQ